MTSVTLVFHCTNHVVLMSSLTIVNQYEYVPRRVTSVVAYWTLMLGVMRSKPDQVKHSFPCSSHVVILHYTKNLHSKVLYFMKNYNLTSLYGPNASGASVNPTSQVFSSAMLVLLIVGSWIVRFKGRFQWHDVHTKFHPNPSSGSRVESCGRTDRHDQPYMRSFYAHHVKNAQ
jgi:hypothetical protein